MLNARESCMLGSRGSGRLSVGVLMGRCLGEEGVQIDTEEQSGQEGII